MTKKIFTYLTLVPTFLYITGCAPLPKIEGSFSESSEELSYVMKVNSPTYDPISEKNNSYDIRSFDFISELIKSSSFDKADRKRKSYESPIADYKGIDIIKNPEGKLSINYINGDYHISSGSTYLTKSFFSASYKYINDKEISFSIDVDYEVVPTRSAIGIEIKPLASMDVLKNDIKNTFKKATEKAHEVKIYQIYKFEGEENSQYPSEAIYSNFERILGKYKGKPVTTNDIIKEHTYNFNGLPLHVEIYPYRNGSKVIYKALISYEVNSKNEAFIRERYNQPAMPLKKADFNKFKKEIKDIINN